MGRCQTETYYRTETSYLKSVVKSETVPLPRARPPVLEDQTSAPKIESERSPCQLQLSEIAEFKSMPPISGPGECTATDVVDVNAVVLPDNQRVECLLRS